jgi:serine/threonine protein kinase
LILGPGDRVGVYELAELLGVGGMGEVYRARDTRLNREVAIKLLHAALASDSERLQRFDQEARATAALSDPNIVAIYDVGIHGGRPFVVSELLEGETLRQALGTGPLPMRKAIGYGQQIARGMAAAHRRGIAHRDLKPENLFITRDGLVKILDFGLAKLARETFATTIAAEATAPGIVMGTIGYMSPEQARGEPSDSRADIFSFGAILYEMLSGQRAFQRASAAETLSAILKEHPPDLTQLVTGLSPELTRIVDRCLEKNREDRFQSATDLSFALEGILGTSTRSAASTHRRPVRWRTAAGVLVAIAATGAAFMMGERLTHGEPPRFQQITFRRGTVQNARFAADGQTIVYAAA